MRRQVHVHCWNRLVAGKEGAQRETAESIGFWKAGNSGLEVGLDQMQSQIGN